MKNIVFIVKLLLLTSFSSFGQFQIKNPNGLNYAPTQQIDSSDFFIIGSLTSKTNKGKYNFNNKESYDNYGGLNIFWTNVFIHNAHDKKITRLFPPGLFAIYPVYNTIAMLKYDYGYPQRGMNSGMSETNIIYLVRTDEYNNDGILDEDDPVYIFMSTKSGTNLRQITPSGMNVTSWKLSKDGKTIIATIQTDKNADKKFTDEDEVIYQIDLSEDISKIKLSAINL